MDAVRHARRHDLEGDGLRPGVGALAGDGYVAVPVTLFCGKRVIGTASSVTPL